jgi:arylsulfatase A-like enzyme
MKLSYLATAILMVMAIGCSGSLDEVQRIVVVTFDTTRADRIGCYGYEQASTPNLDRFAGESVLFEQAVAQAATTLPSHTTMFTGLYPQDHGVRYNLMYTLGAEADTLAESLQAAGYSTAAFPASMILDKRHGLDQGFDTWADPPRVAHDEVVHPDDIMRPAGDGVDLALDWIEKHREEDFFVWLHFYDPHFPYAPPFPYSSQFRDRPYDGDITYADAQFGRLLESLRADPRWRNTLVIVAGDHGEGLHDHGEIFHSYLLYETTQHVPFIIKAPGAGQARVAEPVALADLMPTVLDLAGVNEPGAMRGVSLRPALTGGELPRRDLYFESLAGALNYGWAELRGVRYGGMKLIDSSAPEIFDLLQDPGELNNLAGSDPALLEELRAALTELSEPLIPDRDLALSTHDEVLDPQTEAFLASLGYVGGSSGGAVGEDAPHPLELVDLAFEMLAAQRAIAAGQWAYVEELTRYVLGRDPSNKWALKNGVTALIELGRSEEAQDVGAEYVRIYPGNAPSYANLANAYRAGGEEDKAREVLEQGLKAIPDSEMLAYLSTLVGFEAGQREVCSRELPERLSAFPGSWRILLLQARCQARDGSNEAVLLTLREAMSKGFRSPEMLGGQPEFAEVVKLPAFAEIVQAAKAQAE